MTTLNATNSEPLYCGQGLDDFHTGYLPLHGFLSLLVCVFGSIANGLNIIVLTRREMRSPTNAILTGLAIADMLVMIDYIPFACIFYIMKQLNYSREEQFTYSWTLFIMFHSIFAQICHTISIWLTVTLAVWRYIAVAHPQKNRIWCGMHKTMIAIASSYIVCPFIAIPLYFTFSIRPIVEQLDIDGNAIKVLANNTQLKSPDLREIHNVTLYKMTYSDLAENNAMLIKANFWIYSVIIKLIPCLALTVLSLRLIGHLLEAKRRRKHLCSNVNVMKTMSNGKPITDKSIKNSKAIEKEKQTDRTTRMLLAVLLLFLITEFPQGILGLLSAVLKKQFFMECYLKLGDFMDILALINSAINFILYCSMSRQFRSTFTLLFRPKCLDKWLPIAQSDDGGRTDQAGHNNGQTTQVTNV